ncbi:MAG: hypothetical protein U1E26_06045 [Coriobacteriia bacterium]|nr:hypothetical protein [Coriobacteriia bacterium]
MAYAMRAVYFDFASGGSYTAAEWLINYGGGFVRRGLAGQLILTLAPPGAPSLQFLWLIVACCYLILLVTFLWWLLRSDWTWWSIAVACSPAALPFIAWDWQGAFRKEIVVLTALALLVLHGTRRKGSPGAVFTLSAGVLAYGFAILVWEPSVVALPAVIYMLGDKLVLPLRPHWYLLARASVASLTFAGVAASMAARGDAATVAAIYRAIDEHGLLKTGFTRLPIELLQLTNAQAVAGVVASGPINVLYLPLALLSLLPIVTSCWFRRDLRWVVACLLFSVPLFVVGLDYGRWIHLVVMQLSLMLIAARVPERNSSGWRLGHTLLFVSAWGLPHWGSFTASMRWFGAFGTLAQIVLGG